MKRLANKALPVACSVLLLAGIAAAASYHLRFYVTRNTIQQLQDLPVGHAVRLAGAVTAVDAAGDRFWLQDDTGAIRVARPGGAAPVHVGESVGLEAVKRAHYDDAVGPDSVRLDRIAIYALRAHAPLPAAAPMTPDDFPTGEKADTRVALTGVVRDVERGDDGLEHLTVARSGHEVDVVLPRGAAAQAGLVDAEVTVTGVPEQVRDSQGMLTDLRLWADDAAAVQVDEAAPREAPLESIRQLYSDPAVRNGHRLRLRGRVAAAAPGSLLVEDGWGAMECEGTRMPDLPAGTAVEVDGFPGVDGLRIDLYDATAAAIPEEVTAQLPEGSADALTTVAAVRGLTSEQANQALPVRLNGVVTYEDDDWRLLFLQDATGGVYVKYSGAAQIAFGEKVQVVGLTNAGNFAPVVVAPQIHDEGRGTLPLPRSVDPIEAQSGTLDSQWVRVDGIIHPIRHGTAPGHLRFGLYTDFGQVQTFTAPGISEQELEPLVDARVSVRGVFGTLFNSRRQLVGYQLSVASLSNIEVLETAVRDPFAGPATPIGALLRFSEPGRFGHRVKIQGSVTMVTRNTVWLQDASGGVEVRGNTGSLHIGDRVEAVGYASIAGRYSPVFIDAAFRSLGRNEPASPEPAAVEQILQGEYDSRLVTVEGKLVAVLDGPSGESLLMQSGIHTFTAVLNAEEATEQSWPPEAGSVLRLTGISSAEVNSDELYLLLDQQPVSFRILLRSAADVVVVKAPPYWNLRNAMFLIVAFAVMIVAALIRGNLQRRRILEQREALRKAAETTQAISDLSGAMRELSAHQEFEGEVSVRGNPEIAQLVVGFNGMLAELKKAHGASHDAEARLTQQALTDELTGLPNRRHLSDHLAQSVAAARRHASLMALLYIDLDGFKLVNDSLGHSAGDELLDLVAERLRARTRKDDFLARIGGDEFTIILNQIGTKDDAQAAAESVIETLHQPFQVGGQEITIGASIGICTFPDHANDETDLLQQADSAMYAAKRAGRNRAMFFTSDLGQAIRERLTLENELRRALAESRDLFIHYQPEFDLASGTITRFEALARWNHPTLGSIPPSTFIPIAEESGLIHALGAYVLERACADALTWQASAGQPVQVAINVSSVQFARDMFSGEVMEALRKTGLDPHLLQLELTESSTLIGVERVSKSMQALRDAGVTFALDDFGTGYSCLSYLPELSFDALKIDRAFVKNLLERTETRAMVRTLVSLAQELGMRIIFEGIETPEQLQLIEIMGGHEAQGFLLGRPTGDPMAHLHQKLTIPTWT
ncbi:MAG TPA: EAL domain-containing protein [Acidobacteriaceae bacterium]